MKEIIIDKKLRDNSYNAKANADTWMCGVSYPVENRVKYSIVGIIKEKHDIYSKSDTKRF